MAKMYGKNSGYLKKKDLKHYALSGIIPIILLILIWVVLKNYKQLGDWNFVFILFLLIIIAKLLNHYPKRLTKVSQYVKLIT